eukprot:11518583-Heterocapsa_arctica.AAC.1
MQESTAACHCSIGPFQVSRIEDRPLISLMQPAVLIPADRHSSLSVDSADPQGHHECQQHHKTSI